MREALFSILTARGGLEGARVLDLFAGSGAVGIEALSRGASHATFVENGRPALAALRTNIEVLGVNDQARVVAAPVERSFETVAKGGPFDLVYVDPPYARVSEGAIAGVLAELVTRGCLSSDAVVVLEHAKGDTPPFVPGLTLGEARPYGDTVLSLYATESHGVPSGDGA